MTDKRAAILIGLGLPLILLLIFTTDVLDNKASQTEFKVSTHPYVSFVDANSFTSCEVQSRESVVEEVVNIDLGLGNGKVISESLEHLKYSSLYGSYTLVTNNLQDCLSHTGQLTMNGLAEIPL